MRRGSTSKQWGEDRLLFKTGRCTIKAAEFMQATMVEEEQRVFIAIDKSTAHGTYNNRSFGLAPSVCLFFVQVCTSGWDYESYVWKPVQQACFKITALAELNWMTYGLLIAYLNQLLLLLLLLNTHSYKDAFDQQGIIISTKK